MQNRHAIRRLEVVYLKGNKGGYGLIYQNIMDSGELHRDSLCIYAYLCSFANTDGVCYPTRKRIKSALKMNDATFSKYMKPLIELGVVEVEKTTTERGLYGNNIYHLKHIIDTTHREAPYLEAPYQGVSQSRGTLQRSINNNIINSNIPNNNTLNSNTINNSDKSTLSTICTSTTISTNTDISNIPTVDQVENECSRYGFEIEPEKFVEHCKSRNIKDWKFELYTYSAAAAGRDRNRRKEMKE